MLVAVLNKEILLYLSDILFSDTNLFFTRVIFKLSINYLFNYIFNLGQLIFGKNIFAFDYKEKQVFDFDF